MRLQTFRQHHMEKNHKLNVVNFVRETHPEVALDNIASPNRALSRESLKRERYGKRKKLRIMMYCLAEAHTRATQSLFATTPQQRNKSHLGMFNLVAKPKTADSLALAHSMVSIIREACTEWFNCHSNQNNGN